MNSKLLLGLAVGLSSVLFGGSSNCAQPSVTNEFADGETLARFPPQQVVNSIIFAPDGKSIATLRGEGASWRGWDKPLTLQLWAVPNGTLLWTSDESAFRLCAFSPDSTRLVGISGNGKMAIWKVADGKLERHFPGENTAVFVPDGRTLLTTARQFHGQGAFPITRPPTGEIKHWETKTGRLLRTLKGEPNVISKLAISPGGKTLAVADENAGGPRVQINLLELETGSVRHTLRFHTNVWTVGSLAFSPDGKTFMASSGHHDGKGEIGLWDTASGQLKRTMTDSDLGSAEPRISMTSFAAFSPDGETLVSVGDNQTMIWWDVATGKAREVLREADPPQPGCLTIHFTEDGLLSARVNPLEQVEVQFWNYKK